MILYLRCKTLLVQWYLLSFLISTQYEPAPMPESLSFISPFFLILSTECSDLDPGAARAREHDAGLQEGVRPRQRAAVAHHRRRRTHGRPRGRLHHPVPAPAPAGIRGRHSEGAHGVAPEAGAWRGELRGFPGGERMNGTPPGAERTRPAEQRKSYGPWSGSCLLSGPWSREAWRQLVELSIMHGRG
jgi:hypothetical protein